MLRILLFLSLLSISFSLCFSANIIELSPNGIVANYSNAPAAVELSRPDSAVWAKVLFVGVQEIDINGTVVAEARGFDALDRQWRVQSNQTLNESTVDVGFEAPDLAVSPIPSNLSSPSNGTAAPFNADFRLDTFFALKENSTTSANEEIIMQPGELKWQLAVRSWQFQSEENKLRFVVQLLSSEEMSPTMSPTGPQRADVNTTSPPTTSAPVSSTTTALSSTTTPSPTNSTSSTTPSPSNSSTTTSAPTNSTSSTTPTPTNSTSSTTPTPTNSTSSTTPMPTNSTSSTTPMPTNSTSSTTPMPTNSTSSTTPMPTNSTGSTTPMPTNSTGSTTPMPTNSTGSTTPMPTNSTGSTTPMPTNSTGSTTPIPTNSTGSTTPMPTNSTGSTTPMPTNSTGSTTPMPTNSTGSTTPMPTNSTGSTTPMPTNSSSTTTPAPSNSTNTTIGPTTIPPITLPPFTTPTPTSPPPLNPGYVIVPHVPGTRSSMAIIFGNDTANLIIPTVAVEDGRDVQNVSVNIMRMEGILTVQWDFPFFNDSLFYDPVLTITNLLSFNETNSTIPTTPPGSNSTTTPSPSGSNSTTTAAPSFNSSTTTSAGPHRNTTSPPASGAEQRAAGWVSVVMATVMVMWLMNEQKQYVGE